MVLRLQHHLRRRHRLSDPELEPDPKLFEQDDELNDEIPESGEADDGGGLRTTRRRPFRRKYENERRHDNCEADDASSRSYEAAARAGAAARAAAMGDLAVDAEAGRWLAKAALHGDAAGATRQHNGSEHLDRLRYRAGRCAGRTR